MYSNFLKLQSVFSFHTIVWQAPAGAEDVEILRVVVRETLSEDLIERFIVDILEITEQLTTTDGSLMLTSNTAQGIHHPDHEYGRPEKENFGGQIEGGQEQSGDAKLKSTSMSNLKAISTFCPRYLKFWGLWFR